MDIGGRRRTDNFEDRGRGGGGGGGVPAQALFSLVRFLGPKGALVVAVIGGIGYFVLPSGLRQQLFGALTGQGSSQGAQGAGSVCQASEGNGKACDFSRAVLAST